MNDRERLPSERTGITRSFSIPYTNEDGQPAKFKFWAQASCYPDGRLAEVFVKGEKIGELAGGMLDAFAMAMSVGLQHGVPLSTFVSKLRWQRFGPHGFTGDSEFQSCTSALDLLGSWLEKRFPEGRLVK